MLSVTMKPFCYHHSLARTTSRYLSTVHRGVAFEERALRLLRDHFSMALTRVGGRGDGGIDLLGWWWLPQCTTAAMATTASNSSTVSPRIANGDGRATDLRRRRRIRVVGQCKAEKKKMGPNYVRELEGVMYRLAASPRLDDNLPGTTGSQLDMESTSSSDTNSNDVHEDAPTVAILVSQSPFTQATILRAQSSPIPFLLLHLPPVLFTSPPSANPDSLLDASEQSQSHSFLSPAATTPESPPSPSELTPEPNPSQADSIATALCNMALTGTRGLLQGQMEVRWERSLTGGGIGQPGLWWDGKRLESWVPEGG